MKIIKSLCNKTKEVGAFLYRQLPVRRATMLKEIALLYKVKDIEKHFLCTSMLVILSDLEALKKDHWDKDKFTKMQEWIKELYKENDDWGDNGKLY